MKVMIQSTEYDDVFEKINARVEKVIKKGENEVDLTSRNIGNRF